MGNPVLGLARVLGAAVNQPLAVVLRQGVGNLPFKVIVLLAANFQLAMQLVRRILHGMGGVTALHLHTGQDFCHGVALCHGERSDAIQIAMSLRFSR